jgi:2-phosphosulfolactate phosphatase
MHNRVVIDCFPEHVSRYHHGYAVVAIDVVRATTSAITAVVSGRRCFMVSTLTRAWELAAQLGNAILAGEQRGLIPPGFDINNSPSEILALGDISRPIILLSSSGTALCEEASKCDAAFLACLRNYSSIAGSLAGRFSNVAVIGAGSRGEFREEDQLCCAWIAEQLIELGYHAANRETLDIVRRWSHEREDAWLGNKSAAYLRDSGQLADLEFILSHVADINACFTISDGEVVMDDAPLAGAREEAVRKGIYGA